MLKQFCVANCKFSLGTKWIKNIELVFKCALKEIIWQRNNMRKTLQWTWKVTTVIDVAYASETKLSVLLWLASLFPFFNVIKTKARFVVEDLIVFHALLAAVEHFMAPFTAKIYTLIWKILAITAFAVNIRLHSCR